LNEIAHEETHPEKIAEDGRGGAAAAMPCEAG
jgi:hypothetical protein